MALNKAQLLEFIKSLPDDLVINTAENNGTGLTANGHLDILRNMSASMPSSIHNEVRIHLHFDTMLTVAPNTANTLVEMGYVDDKWIPIEFNDLPKSSQ